MNLALKVSLATTLNHSKGGQFIVHAKALPGKPYDGHTLGTVIPEIEKQIGVSLKRIFCDAGYKGCTRRSYSRPRSGGITRSRVAE